MLKEWFNTQVEQKTKFNSNIIPTINDREVWDSVDNRAKEIIIKRAEEKMGYNWPVIFATDFMQFRRTFDRQAYEDKHFPRRRALADFVLAECFENKGRFYDDIINLLVLICEESYWGVSAHRYDESLKLPDVTDHYIDLFASETAETIANIRHILKDYLKAEYPELLKRIDYELNNRIINQYLKHDDYWYMGFSGKYNINNWNTWINSNVLNVFLLCEDTDKKTAGIKKICESIDYFINSYKPDGGCNEGPGYWGHAGGSLFMALYLLQRSTGKCDELFENRLIKNIGAYIRKVHICKHQFMCFSDGSPKMTPQWVSYKFGEITGDSALTALGASGYKCFTDCDFGINRQLCGILDYSAAKSFNTKAHYSLHESLDNLEVFAFRQCENIEKGFFVGGKGGNNDESHNHNDVGNAVIYYNGEPVIIDTGRLNYTAKTFSRERYTIWVNASDWHNTPTVNSAVQQAGPNFAAENYQTENNGDISAASLNFAKAYPESSNLNSLLRKVYLNRNENSVTICDEFEFKGENNSVCENFLFANEPKLKGNNIIYTVNGQTLTATFPKEFSAEVFEKTDSDSIFQNNWNGRAFRVQLKLNCGKNARFTLKFSAN